MSPVTVWHPGVVLDPIDLSPAIIAGIKAALSPVQAAALTAWREAEASLVKGRGWVPNPIEAMVDIITVLGYRAHDTTRRRWRHLDLKGVCLERWAFSCWEPTGGPDDPHDADALAENFETVMAYAQRLLAGELPNGRLLECLAAAEASAAGALVKTLPADTCHYFAEWMPAPPAWAFVDPKTRTLPRTPVAHRHGHLFYAGVP